MTECIVCLEELEKIPLLKCSHFVCPTCYCSLKNRRIDNCLYCQKKMIRGNLYKRKVNLK